MDNLFEISNEVRKAIDLKKPIVALESTLISHGLPYPDNIKVAKESINAVQDNGSVAGMGLALFITGTIIALRGQQ